MKTPDEIKKGLEICLAFPTPKDSCNRCPYISERSPTGICRTSLKNDAIALVQQIEAEKGKPGNKLICKIAVCGEDILRKALDKTEVDGKTLAEWIELARGYEQLEQDLATAKQELDAAVSALHGDCGICAFQQTVKCDSCRYGVNPFYGHDCWEWEGISPDTEVQDGNNATKG